MRTRKAVINPETKKVENIIVVDSESDFQIEGKEITDVPKGTPIGSRKVGERYEHPPEEAKRPAKPTIEDRVAELEAIVKSK